MMTLEAFAAMAHSFPESTQGSHFGTTDFRVSNKIFATLRPEKQRGVLMLTRDDQAMMRETSADMFEPVPGGWGEKGATFVILAMAEPDVVRHAMAMAWRKAAPKSVSARHQL
ncbi:MmcQ/YjbR family DNA-binding protein [Phyllobacterium sp. SYP-B3895]|uniref:MmcQ/YjbR family DNA-binding protein n=1 Tax=Phyllobacterium sp. SYP-B3895 TaxID=2663240 RepID=UPI001562444F|nr:MmcQ/YjbR family DNA-binding protein [Phyllobacterium sp. SYP-B3895]